MKLSGLREDTFALKVLHSKATNQERKIALAAYAELPLLVIPRLRSTLVFSELVPGYEKPEATDWDKYFEGAQYNAPNGNTAEDIHMFDEWYGEFMFIINMGVRTAVYGHVKQNSLSEYDISLYQINRWHDGSPAPVLNMYGVLSYREGSWGTHYAFGVYEGEHTQETQDFISQVSSHITSMGTSLEEQNKETFTNIVYMLAGFHEFAFHADQYLTLVRDTKPKSAREKRTRAKKPWLIRNAPKLVYLNKLPSSATEDEIEHLGGTHASPIPHQRRGSWRTLKHEKFKNHPQYQVEKGVYARPCFVGDTDKVVEGTRYTIVTSGLKSKT